MTKVTCFDEKSDMFRPTFFVVDPKVNFSYTVLRADFGENTGLAPKPLKSCFKMKMSKSLGFRV